MADIFTNEDTFSLLKNKFIMFIGDSNVRALYKDLLYLLHRNSIIPAEYLFRVHSEKKWHSFEGDTVLALPKVDNAGRDYYEQREYKDKHLHLRFHFITRAYGDEMVRTLVNMERGKIPIPHIIIINSCMWDLTRWGPQKEDVYKRDLVSLFSRLRTILPEESVIIWNSTAPFSSKYTKGGVLVQQLEFVKHSLRFMVLEANKFTQLLCRSFGFDFIDMHYHMRYQLHRRSIDGIHWEPQAIRLMLCVILTHVSLAMEKPLPGVVRNKYIRRTIDAAFDMTEIQLPSPCFDVEIEKKVKKQLEDIEKKRQEMNIKNRRLSESKDPEKNAPEDRVTLSAKRRIPKHDLEIQKGKTPQNLRIGVELRTVTETLRDQRTGVDRSKDLPTGIEPLMNLSTGIEPQRNLRSFVEPPRNLCPGIEPTRYLHTETEPQRDLRSRIEPPRDLRSRIEPPRDLSTGTNRLEYLNTDYSSQQFDFNLRTASNSWFKHPSGSNAREPNKLLITCDFTSDTDAHDSRRASFLYTHEEVTRRNNDHVNQNYFASNPFDQNYSNFGRENQNVCDFSRPLVGRNLVNYFGMGSSRLNAVDHNKFQNNYNYDYPYYRF